MLSHLVDAPVLIIDELGKGLATDWQTAILDELLSKRYNRSVTTLFSTNYPFEVSGAPRARGERLRARHARAAGGISAWPRGSQRCARSASLRRPISALDLRQARGEVKIDE